MPEALKTLPAADYSRFYKVILGSVVFVWLIVLPALMVAEAITGVKVNILSSFESALTTMATMIIGALVKDMISPTRQAEQDNAKLEAVAAIANAPPAVVSEVLKEAPKVAVKT